MPASIKRSPRDPELELPRGRVSPRRPSALRPLIARLEWQMRRGRRGARPARVDTPMASASSRRVVIKVRVVPLDTPEKKQRALRHFSYIEREGVERDGSAGVAYDADGTLPRGEHGPELEDEPHQFRMVISPEDGPELDLKAYVRTYMQRVEHDLGRQLIWLAVNHYNTDNPHAHVVIRGVDTQGREVSIDPEYISHGLRNRAQELSTQLLGPVLEVERIDRLRREAELHRYTGLDAVLERRAADGELAGPRRDLWGRLKDPHREGALRRRLEVLARLGLASRTSPDDWILVPAFGDELRRLQRREDALRVIQQVMRVDPARCLVIDREEPHDSIRKTLDEGVRGVLRWQGLDEAGRFCAVVETVGGTVYHLPIHPRVLDSAKVGQVLDLKHAKDKDARIEETAARSAGRFDVHTLPEEAQPAYARRLEQLERMHLAQRIAPGVWSVREDFQEHVNDQQPQAYWQMLSLRTDPQPLRQQARYAGYVWLDRVAQSELGTTGFGREVRNALDARHDYLRRLGIEPAAKDLEWRLRDVQRELLEAAIAKATSRVPLAARAGLEGVVHLHVKENGQRFLEIRGADHFVVHPATRGNGHLVGKEVRFEPDQRGNPQLVLTADADHQRAAWQAEALRQIAAATSVAPEKCRVIEPDRFTEAERKELGDGTPGVLRALLSDAPGRHYAVVEAATGRVYHVPVSAYAAPPLQVGQLLELKPAVGKDQRLEAGARENDRVYDLGSVPEQYRGAFRRRLHELERQQLAKPLGEERWRLVEGFVERSQARERYPVVLYPQAQPLAAQSGHAGPVWLDGVRFDAIGEGSFAAELRTAVRERHEYLRAKGLDPQSDRLRWQLRDLQQAELARALAAARGCKVVRARVGFEGTLHLHRGDNGERFIEIRSEGHLVVVPAAQGIDALADKPVRIERVERGRVVVVGRTPEQERGR